MYENNRFEKTQTTKSLSPQPPVSRQVPEKIDELAVEIENLSNYLYKLDALVSNEKFEQFPVKEDIALCPLATTLENLTNRVRIATNKLKAVEL